MTALVAVAVSASTGGLPSARRLAKPEIRRAEVVPPLADAVRLVDDEKIDLLALQLGDERRIRELFGCREDELRISGRDAVEMLVLLGTRQGGVHLRSGQAEAAHLVVLILHERDERRNDDRHSREKQCGQLIAEGFARSGGHHGQGIGAGQDRGDHLVLAGPK